MLLASLVEPAFGLIFWMTLSFGIVFFLLAKFPWKPILKPLHERELSIEDAIGEAKKARDEVASMKADNEELLQKARAEREHMLKEARDIRDKEVAEAKDRAKTEADALLARAREDIRNEKNAAIVEMKNKVGELSILVAERILRQKLDDKTAQQSLVDQVLKESGTTLQ